MGELAHEVLGAESGSARVLAGFRKAMYLSAPSGDLVVLTAPGAPLGPLHVPVPALPPVAAGDQMPVDEGAVLVCGTWWHATVPPWSGAVPPRSALPAAAALAAQLAETAAAPQLWPGTSGLPAPAERAIRAGDLDSAAALLGGLGPGLTPVGDDVLAGALFAAALGAGPAEVVRLCGVARRVRTNRIAGAFLLAAARGQCIAPVHDLVMALARGDIDAARRSCGQAAGFGATSGHALVYGVLRGLRYG